MVIYHVGLLYLCKDLIARVQTASHDLETLNFINSHSSLKMHALETVRFMNTACFPKFGPGKNEPSSELPYFYFIF